MLFTGKGARGRRLFAGTAATIAAFLALSVVSPLAAAADEYDPLAHVLVQLQKTVTPETVVPATPNGRITYSIGVNCSDLETDCINLRIEDELPAPLVLQSVTMSEGPAGSDAPTSTIAIDGNSFVATFTTDFGGSQGLTAGASAEFIVTATVPADASADLDGQTLVNTANAVLDNLDSNKSASASIPLSVPTTLGAVVTKTISPSTLPATAGTVSTITLDAQNTANRSVDSLTIQDPATSTTLFDYAAVTAITVPTWPTGADRVQVDWFTTSWQLGTPSATISTPSPATSIKGLRFTFTSSAGIGIARDAHAVVAIATALRSGSIITNVNPSVTAANTVSATVSYNGVTSTPATATAALTINKVSVNPVASKVFTPDSIVGGNKTTVVLTGSNGGNYVLKSLAISEPATGTATLESQGLAFDSWVANAIEWPVGATAAAVSFLYSDAAGAYATAVQTTTRNTLPAPESGRTVIGFIATFTGTTINVGQYAKVPYVATSTAVTADVTTTNTIGVTAITSGNLSASTTASDDLTRRTARVNTSVSKTMTPSTVYSVAGAYTVVSLPAFVAPQPTGVADPLNPTGSTVGATSFTVSDTADPATDPFWDSFDATAIVSTDIPVGATMSVEFWSGSAWVALDSAATDIAGPLSYSRTFTSTERSDIGGLRFIFEPVSPTAELAPGFNVQPNFKAVLRSTLRSDPSVAASGFADDATIANTVRSEVENVSASPTHAQADAARTLSVLGVSGGGSGGIDMISKVWNDAVSTGIKAVNARSGDQVTSTLSWGTGGLGFESVVVSDTRVVSGDAPGAVAGTAFDAFDLVSIAPITSSTDSLMKWDAVSAVELYYNGDWQPTATDPCATAGSCDAKFPGYTLTPTERQNATAARLVFVESPTRSTRIGGNPLAPQVGSGVAPTLAQTRHITFTFELRDVRRSNGSAVLGTGRGAIYNSGPGLVVNDASIVAHAFDNSTRTDTDSDSIQIIDKPINVLATKTWSDGPLGTPPANTPQALYPTARLVVSATNSSVIRVNTLTLTEPAAGTNPFEFVNLTRILSITVPSGATSTKITLQPSGEVYTNVADVVALTASELEDVTSIEVVFDGRIVANGKTTVTMNTQLRQSMRSTGDPIAPQILDNTMQASVIDPSGTTPPETGTDNIVPKDASAQMAIEVFEYGVVATKNITADTSATSKLPAIQYGGSSNKATISLGGRPTGNVRTTRMVIEDITPTFWNAYAFDNFTSNSLISPINRVQVEVLVGTTYELDGDGQLIALCNGITTLDDCWISDGTAASSFTLPSGSYTKSEIRGVRFTFTRSDYSAWERPFNPDQFVNFTVARRTNLTWDPSGEPTPVPSTLYIYKDAAPGETELATFTNGVTVVAAAARDAKDTKPLWTATDTQTRQLTYKHLPARVEVGVKPTGSLSLGPEIPYQIDITNRGITGEKPLTGVVATFTIPVDGLGPQLVLPIDPDTGDPIPLTEAFTYKLVNASNVTQTAPAVVASLATATPSGQVVTFTVPASIPLGWKLTVSMRLNFRALLEAGTAVLTPVVVTSDQQFDTCDAFMDDGIALPTLTDQSDCTTSTTVRPLASVPMTITKGVRGVEAGPLDADGNPVIDAATGLPFDDLGVLKTATNNLASCAAPSLVVEDESYYKFPCVPITRPGATEEWVAKFSNSGNVSVGKVVAIDLLPTANDTGVIISDSRGSRWTPKLSEFPKLSGVADGNLTVYYTSTPLVATPRCNGADIQNEMGMSATSSPAMTPEYQVCLKDTGKIDDVPNRKWVELLPSDDLSKMSIVALKFVVTSKAGIAPGTSMAITYRSTTAAVQEIVESDANLGRDAVAYNSIAGAAVGINRDTQVLDLAYRFVTEPRKVGVAMATGQVRLLKTVDGSALATFKPTSFALSLTCVSAGQTIVLKSSTGATRSPFTVTAGSELLVQGIPLYAECTVTEDTDYGQTAKSITPEVVTAQASQTALVGSQVTNEHPTFGTGTRPAIELSTVTNTYSAATLVVTKTVDNGGAVNQAGTAIKYSASSFTVVCTFDKGAGPTQIYSSGTFTLASGANRTITGLVAGAACTVTETNQRGAQTTTHTLTQNGTAGSATTSTSRVVTLVANTPTYSANNTVAFTNTYGIGSLTVRKVVDGNAQDTWGNGTFTLHVTCTLDTANPTTVWSEDIELTKAGTTQIADRLVSAKIAGGASCAVTEADDKDAGATSKVVPASTVVAVGDADLLTVTNTFTNSSLTVTKAVQTNAVDQTGATVYPAVTYDFSVSCMWEGRTVLTSQTFSLARTESQTFSDLPTGARCTIVETGVGGADSTTIETTTGAGTTSTNATTATTADLTTGANSTLVTNRYGVASFTVTKAAVGGAAAQFGAGPFTIHVTCTEPSGVTAFDADVVLGAGGIWDKTIENLVTGSKCSAVEADLEGADSQSTIFDANDIVTGNLVTVTTANPGHATIQNWYLTGSIVVTKQVAGDGADYGVGPFTVSLACERDGESVTIVGGAARTLQPGAMSTTYTKLPSGAVCTLTETETGGATSSFIATNVSSPLTYDVATGEDFSIVVNSASHVDDQAQTPVFVVNNFDPASLVISKRVVSDAVDASGAAITYGPFPVSVTCLFEGAPIYADGYSSTVAMQKNMTAGVDWRLDGLVAGAKCEITETDTKDAIDSYIDTTTGLTARHWNTTTATVTLAANDGTTPKTTARISNPYAAGQIDLSKTVSGLGSAWATDIFTVTVVCELTDASGTRSVWNKSYDLTAGATATPLAGIAAGSDCRITETKTGGSSATSIAIGTATAVDDTVADFVSPAGSTVAVVVNNAFDLATVDVTKQFTGAGETLWGAGPFEVTLTCERQSNGATLPVTIPGGDKRTLAGPTYTASFTDLPYGADCTLVENKTGGANTSTVSPAGSFSLDQPNNDVTVINGFTEGEIAVEKLFTGDGTALWGDGPFETTLQCTRVVDGATQSIAIPGGATRALESGTGYTAEYKHLPTGAACTLTETKTGGATTAAAPITATVVAGTTVQLQITNDFQIGDLIVTNIVTGNNWEPNSKKPFVVELVCTLDIDGVATDLEIPGGASRDIMHLGEVTYEDLPIGAVCDLFETETHGAEIVTITPVTPKPTVTSGRGSAPILALKTVTITSVTSQFDVVNVFTKLANTGLLVIPFGLAGLLVTLIGVALFASSRLNRARRTTA